MSQNNIRTVLEGNPVVPVVKIQSLEEVVPLVTALQDHNINCIEITLRTDCAIDALPKSAPTTTFLLVWVL